MRVITIDNYVEDLIANYNDILQFFKENPTVAVWISLCMLMMAVVAYILFTKVASFYLPRKERKEAEQDTVVE